MTECPGCMNPLCEDCFSPEVNEEARRKIALDDRLTEAQRRYDEAKREEARASEAALFAASHRQRMAQQLELAKHAHAALTPVDRSAQMLTDGSPVPEDRSHTEHTASGQQKGYVVLTPAERAKGFVRPVRGSYRHDKCGNVTTMSRAIAETYARDPFFYSGTFCTTCKDHFPVGPEEMGGQFVWLENDGKEVNRVGT